jgi:hypothetical protein
MGRQDIESEADTLVLEGILVTTNSDGSPNISPMGPIVDRELTHFVLRPFNTSQTYTNLQAGSSGVFHVIDDVDILARAAVGRLHPVPPLLPTPSNRAQFLAECCRWFELRVDSMDTSQPRVEVRCSVTDHGRQRDFFGWNRAKHAVLEAAILATRIGILSSTEINEQLSRLSLAVAKTAGKQEREAMRFLREYIEGGLADNSEKSK